VAGIEGSEVGKGEETKLRQRLKEEDKENADFGFSLWVFDESGEPGEISVSRAVPSWLAWFMGSFESSLCRIHDL
jgi:hypothetical protein